MSSRHVNRLRQDAEAITSPELLGFDVDGDGMGADISFEKRAGALVTLKNGASCEVGWARFIFRMLRSLLETDLKHFVRFRDVVQGTSSGLDAASVRVLTQYGLMTSDGQPTRRARDVFLSSYRETPDGPTLVDPFSPESPAQETAIRDAEQRANARLKRLGESSRDDESPER